MRVKKRVWHLIQHVDFVQGNLGRFEPHHLGKSGTFWGWQVTGERIRVALVAADLCRQLPGGAREATLQHCEKGLAIAAETSEEGQLSERGLKHGAPAMLVR